MAFKNIETRGNQAVADTNKMEVIAFGNSLIFNVAILDSRGDDTLKYVTLLEDDETGRVAFRFTERYGYALDKGFDRKKLSIRLEPELRDPNDKTQHRYSVEKQDDLWVIAEEFKLLSDEETADVD